MSSVDAHRRQAPSTVRCKIITVSDTRTPETDKSGQLIISLLEENGYTVVDYSIVKDEYEDIRRLVLNAAEKKTKLRLCC